MKPRCPGNRGFTDTVTCANSERSEVLFGSYLRFSVAVLVLVNVEVKGALPGLWWTLSFDTGRRVLVGAEKRQRTVLDLSNSQKWLPGAWTVKLKSSFLVYRPLGCFLPGWIRRPNFLMCRLLKYACLL